MRSSHVVGFLAFAASTALATPQGVTASIAPQAPAPAGCSPSYSGKFQITVQNVTTGSKVKRDALECTLSGGVLKDAQGRIGYIASNYQFQFDGPPQAGALYTAGFSLCGNGSLALGGNAIWYQCLSGGFYNLYDRSWAAQCSPIYIEAIGYSSSAAATQRPDGQPIATTAVSQRTDGQPTASSTKTAANVTGAPVSQLPDGQIQATPIKPSASITGAPVSQISDGQIQAGTPTRAAANVSSTYTPAQVTVNAAPMHAAGSFAIAGLFAVFAALL